MSDDQNRAGKMLLVAILWPDESNYARLCAISADYMPPTLAEYRATQHRRIVERGLLEAHFIKVAFDPDELARWCGAQRRPVDTEAREAYAKLAVEAEAQRSKRDGTNRRTNH